MNNTINNLYDIIEAKECAKCDLIRQEIKEQIFYDDGLIIL